MNPSPQQIAEIAIKQDEKAKAIRAAKADEANRGQHEVEAARVIQVWPRHLFTLHQCAFVLRIHRDATTLANSNFPLFHSLSL